MDNSETKPRARVIIRKAEDAKMVGPEVMPWLAVRPGDTEKFDELTVRMRQGVISRILFQEPESKLTLAYVWLRPNFQLPRHSHSADCTYYVISGSAIFGKETLKAGDVFFVPGDIPYFYQAGPEGVEVIEFRTVMKSNFMLHNLDKRYLDRAGEIAEQNDDSWQNQQVPEAVARFLR